MDDIETKTVRRTAATKATSKLYLRGSRQVFSKKKPNIQRILVHFFRTYSSVSLSHSHSSKRSKMECVCCLLLCDTQNCKFKPSPRRGIVQLKSQYENDSKAIPCKRNLRLLYFENKAVKVQCGRAQQLMFPS